MLGNLYPFWAAISANLIAQIIKPLFRYYRTGKWETRLLIDSGGFPSSHTSMVTALCLAVGIQEKFSSTLFAVVLIFSLIVMYDAANVRYYAGRNIQITQQLIRDIQTLTTVKFDDPIYLLKVKEVLGHQWFEVFGGVVLGLLVASILFFMR